jgi:protein ImuB
VPATVTTAEGALVRIDERLGMNGAPARVTIDDSPPAEVVSWAGPWPVEERWWAPAESDRRVRFQMLLADGRALLLALSGGNWFLEAVYD